MGNHVLKKHLNENNIQHYLVTFDLMEYNFKDIYRSLNVSFFSKDKELLIKNMVNSEELEYYESIEKSAKDVVMILIRKFKLRITFRKNFNFSKQILISDDYAFEPNILNDESIKIAIVKDNFDKWVNLKDYDYIFTFKDHVKDLKEYGIVFPIENKSVFSQIKFILNDLYKRKSNKFYFFLKRIHFDRVFPKTNDYFKVLNSDYFDDQWYRDTYNLEDNTDSVIHFLLVGSKKGCNPGPNFDTNEYYECNMDVKVKGINPLVHYEAYGKKENRFISIVEKNKRDYQVILNSSYFDKEWYENTYDLSEDIDPVDHYLHEGYIKRYNPGPNFSTQEYFDCNRDIKRVLVNPLVHYELSGRKENRTIYFSDERHQKDYDEILNSSYFDKDWYESTYDDVGENIDPVYHYLNIGYVKGYNPGPNFSTDEYLACNEDVKEHGMNPLVHYERYGRKENRKISLDDD